MNKYYHLSSATKFKLYVVKIDLTHQMGSVESPLHLMVVFNMGRDSADYF